MNNIKKNKFEHKILDYFENKNNLLKCIKCDYEYPPNTQVNTLKKHFFDNHQKIWDEIKVKRKKIKNNKDENKNKNKDININEIKNLIKNLLLKYYQELLKIKENEIKELKEEINKGELNLLDLILDKQKELGVFINE
jgi:hypothetical protein